MDRRRALEEMLRIGEAASRVLLEKYEGDLAVEWKGHNDPVTALDREVNALVVLSLEKSFPGVPIVAEESDPATWAARNAPEAFFVDPVDGTKDLILRNGEFSVMLGLAEAGRPTAGVVVWPTERRSFIGAAGEGAHEIAGDGSRKVIRVADPKTQKDVRALVSRSHPDPAVLAGVVGHQVAGGSADQARAISAATRTLLRARSRFTSRLRPPEASTM